MRWFCERACDPSPSQAELDERRAAAVRARRETAALQEEIEARSDAVAEVASHWSELRRRNHFGELITTALRGREA